MIPLRGFDTAFEVSHVAHFDKVRCSLVERSFVWFVAC